MPTADDPTSATMAQIAQVARTARVSRGWSQGELAVAAGVSRPTVARIEAGNDVSISSLEKVAAALGLHVELRKKAR